MTGQNPASQQEVVSFFSIFLPSRLPFTFLEARAEEHRSEVFPRALAPASQSRKGRGLGAERQELNGWHPSAQVVLCILQEAHNAWMILFLYVVVSD